MEILIGVGLALWLGILTSISPCPFATNVAAVSFLSKKIMHPAMVSLSGLAYTLGRMVAYAGLGWIIISSLVSVPQVAQFLQKYMGKALGPFLILAGLVLLEVIPLRLPGFSFSQKHESTFMQAGAPGAFLLGVVFALAFCPVSAALFFGSLIPLALNHPAGRVLPFVYGIGTGLPVCAFAIALACGAQSLNRWFNLVTKAEYPMRMATGIIFIIVGLYYSGVYLLKLL